ncbi:hypothetical protein QR680_007507 [Steinernema hermaphroditum]|uniref:BTB domain-containing protein n=1 Tax=Steinernema hermaphroditum TaxID=289476 RepID=A0AA39IDE2_9BILA|nr:hypothetical protein QR680_007507 [Steinernema hermaphroditum]
MCSYRGKIDNANDKIHNLDSLIEPGDYADVVFVVEGQRFPAHRALLASKTEYFQRMLYGEFSEGYRREVEIGDAKPETFGRILQYLYTMKIQLTDTEFDDILDMLQLAHLYQLQGLQNEISEHLKGEISSDNTCSLLRYAKLFALQGLADACVENFEADTLNVLRNSDFSEAPVEIIELLLSRDDLFVEELEVFRALRAWISWHEPVSAELRERVLKLVQLPKMKIQDLLISVRPTKLFEDKDLLDALDVQREENAFIDGYRLPCPTENVATLERGAYVITGQMSGSAQSRNVLLDCSNSLNKSISCRLLSSEGITVKLGCCYLIGSIEFTLWDGDDRYYSYYVETSTDGDEWCVAADSTNEECQSVQRLQFDRHPVKYIRIVGTDNSFGNNTCFSIYKFRCPAVGDENLMLSESSE